MRPPTALLAALCLSLLGACHGESAAPTGSSGRATFITTSGPVQTAPLELARTDAEHERGLMGRTELAGNSGMVFVYGGETGGFFWMKDTSIPLSIAFWGDDGRIVDLFEMELCTADPCTKYTPRASYTTALEMNAGWFDRHGVQIGDRVELQLPSG